MDLLADSRVPDAPSVAAPPQPASWRWLVAIAAAVVAISVGHYATDPAHVHWHVVFQRLYYLPILVAAALYGVRGGLSVAVLTAVLYLPHVVLHWGHDTAYRWAQFTEIGLFPVFGALAGVLIDRIRAERERHRRTAAELARAYEQLRTTFARLRLEDRMSALGELSVGMAHEIRNPLGSISGAIEILEDAVPPDDERREFVDILKREIARLDDLVGRQLDLARPGPRDLEDCDVVAIARDVVELARKRASSQDVVVVTRLERALAPVRADGARLRQAILNLVVNAVQAMPDGGELCVRAEEDEAEVRLIVEDRGPGIASEARARMFEPFFTTKPHGTGLGLAIAWQIARRHGGDLRAEDRAGGGARFVLALPTAAAAARSEAS